MGLSKNAVVFSSTPRQEDADLEGDQLSVESSEQDIIVSSNTSNLSLGGTGKTKDSSGSRKGFAEKETSVVRRLRFLTFLVLFVTAATASVAVYLYSKNDEQNSFQRDFQGHGATILNSFQDDAYKKCQALAALSTTLTRYALDKKMTWPFVTVFKSAYLLQPYLSIGDFAALNILPIVPKELRELWEIYSVEFQGWIDEDLQARADFHQANDSNSPSTAISNEEEGARRMLAAFDDFHNSGVDKVPASTTDRRELYTYQISYEEDTNRESTSAPYVEDTNRENAITPYIKNYVGLDTSPGDWVVWWQYGTSNELPILLVL